MDWWPVTLPPQRVFRAAKAEATGGPRVVGHGLPPKLVRLRATPRCRRSLAGTRAAPPVNPHAGRERGRCCGRPATGAHVGHFRPRPRPLTLTYTRYQAGTAGYVPV